MQTPPQPIHQMALVPQSEYDVTRPVSYTAKHVPQVAPPEFQLQRKPAREEGFNEAPAFIDATLGKHVSCYEIYTARPESFEACHTMGRFCSICIPLFHLYYFLASMIRMSLDCVIESVVHIYDSSTSVKSPSVKLLFVGILLFIVDGT